MPSPNIGCSRVQGPNSRRARTIVTASAELLYPVLSSHEQLQEDLRKRMKRYNDRGTRALSERSVNEEVYIQPIPCVNKRWKKGMVIAKVEVRYYEINTGGKINRRSRVQPRRHRERGELEARPMTVFGEVTTTGAAKTTQSGRAYGSFSGVDAAGPVKGM